MLQIDVHTLFFGGFLFFIITAILCFFVSIRLLIEQINYRKEISKAIKDFSETMYKSLDECNTVLSAIEKDWDKKRSEMNSELAGLRKILLSFQRRQSGIDSGSRDNNSN